VQVKAQDLPDPLGVSEPADLPDVDHVHGDRDGHLDRLRGRRWDVVLDTCAYFPRAVREVAGLANAFGSYALVSTLGVHPDDIPAGWNEETPTYQPPFPDTEEVTGETYGPLKVACEREAVRAFGDACLIIRPGYIVGPHDPTDRFTYYVRRAASGGEMLAPGPPDASFQVVDVRDLAIFMLDRITARDSGVYGVVGPGEPIAMRDVLEAARDAADANTTFTWASEAFLNGLRRGPELVPDVGAGLGGPHLRRRQGRRRRASPSAIPRHRRRHACVGCRSRSARSPQWAQRAEAEGAPVCQARCGRSDGIVTAAQRGGLGRAKAPVAGGLCSYA